MPLQTKTMKTNILTIYDCSYCDDECALHNMLSDFELRCVGIT